MGRPLCKCHGEPMRVRTDTQSFRCAVKAKAAEARYRATPEGKAAKDRYNASPEGKAAKERYNASPGGKAAKERFLRNNPGYRIIYYYTKEAPKRLQRLEEEIAQQEALLAQQLQDLAEKYGPEVILEVFRAAEDA